MAGAIPRLSAKEKPMKRKPLTLEQIAARDARRAAFRASHKKVADLGDLGRAQLAARMGNVRNVEGRPLSVRNTCLLAFQIPSATIVGGFRQWLAHGRAVRKGEHGAMIWIPTMSKTSAETGATSEPQAETGEPQGELGFMTATVFDISQTQEIPATETTANPSPETESPVAVAAGKCDVLKAPPGNPCPAKLGQYDQDAP
jgi:hypothetical protein